MILYKIPIKLLIINSLELLNESQARVNQIRYDFAVLDKSIPCHIFHESVRCLNRFDKSDRIGEIKRSTLPMAESQWVLQGNVRFHTQRRKLNQSVFKSS